MNKIEETFNECIQEMESLRRNPREYDSSYDTAVSWSNEMLDKCIEIVKKQQERYSREDHIF